MLTAPLNAMAPGLESTAVDSVNCLMNNWSRKNFGRRIPNRAVAKAVNAVDEYDVWFMGRNSRRLGQCVGYLWWIIFNLSTVGRRIYSTSGILRIGFRLHSRCTIDSRGLRSGSFCRNVGRRLGLSTSGIFPSRGLGLNAICDCRRSDLRLRGPLLVMCGVDAVLLRCLRRLITDNLNNSHRHFYTLQDSRIVTLLHVIAAAVTAEILTLL